MKDNDVDMKKSWIDWVKFAAQILGYVAAFLGGSAISGCTIIPFFNF